MLGQAARRAAGGLALHTPTRPGGLGAPWYSLELDISLVQKVGVKEPTEKKVQAGGGRRGAAQKEEQCVGHLVGVYFLLPRVDEIL